PPARPKQLLKIVGEKTMIRATIDRVSPVTPYDRIMVVTGARHAEKIRVQIPEIPNDFIVTEPVGRNTAPCVALAAYRLAKIDPDAVMLVLPADHLITKEDEFRAVLEAATELAANTEDLLTFGIVPDRPETGYGYIHVGDKVTEFNGLTAHRVERFVEKPDIKTAQSYLKLGNYLWNSGMFIWKVSTIIKAIERYLPVIAKAMEKLHPVFNTPDEDASLAEVYEDLPDISIDYGVLERADNVLVVPIDVGWNDVGSWTSLQDVWNTDEEGNAVKGKILTLNAKGCVVSSPQKLTALVGVEDIIVVDTPDAILVCRKDRAQDIKQLQELLKKHGYQGLL
ncbi:MAG: mannose-1-phosphate guanylyltransferase, partial [Deltaproteobacteria bacterium]|nr:mannose-1-phosphate guanylyltransferase [Deltaproteobacteria bacterium]